MKFLAYSMFVVTKFSFIYSYSLSPLVIQYKCRLADSSCLTASSQAVVPALAEGVPELGTDRLDPLILDNLHIDFEDYKTDWKNIHINGLKNSVIDKLSIDMDLRLVRLIFHTDFTLKAQYIADGYLLSLPIKGEGDVSVKCENVQMEFIIPFEIIKDGHGREVINLKGFQYWFDVKGDGGIHYDNLYYGDSQLSQKMHLLLRENWKQITVKYGRFLLDKINDRIFDTVRSYLLARPLSSMS